MRNEVKCSSCFSPHVAINVNGCFFIYMEVHMHVLNKHTWHTWNNSNFENLRMNCKYWIFYKNRTLSNVFCLVEQNEILYIKWIYHFYKEQQTSARILLTDKYESNLDVQCNTRSLNSRSYLRRADADVLFVFTFHFRNIKVTEQKTF